MENFQNIMSLVAMRALLVKKSLILFKLILLHAKDKLPTMPQSFPARLYVGNVAVFMAQRFGIVQTNIEELSIGAMGSIRVVEIILPKNVVLLI